MPDPVIKNPASYRDPSGFVFEKDGLFYRQVNAVYRQHFDHFIDSGCYDHLVKNRLLIPHEVIKENITGSTDYFCTLKPERIHFLSWPYEWSFNMLKDAALLTLRLVKEAIVFGIILKDATPYNIQWHQGRLIFIDTLSFEKYNEDEPWIAYHQFCESFLAPLLLMHYSSKPLQEMSLAYPDGIPLSTAASLLPWKSKFSLHTYLHLHLHAKLAAHHSTTKQKKIRFSKQKMLNLINSLEGLVSKLKLPDAKSTWSEYYEEASQRKDYLQVKKRIIEHWASNLQNISFVVDLGANEGEFSKLLAEKNIAVVAADSDPYCINKLYLEILRTNLTNIQPLILDLTHPSPAIGVNNEERTSFIQRTSADLALALALIHHLCIGKNIPFEKVAHFMATVSRYLIIEFVPKNDFKVSEMLRHKKDIYTDYTEEKFIKSFKKNFTILAQEKISGSERTLFLMKKYENPVDRTI